MQIAIVKSLTLTIKKRITSNDIIPGFQFMHAGIPATVKHVSDGFARFISDDGSEAGSIAVIALVNMANRTI